MSTENSQGNQGKNKILKESINYFHTYIENAPDGVFLADENGRYLEVNTASERITGYTRAELLSMSISQLLPPEGREEGIRHFTEVRDTGKASGEFTFLHKNGSKRWWSVNAVKLSETRYLGFTKDITRQKQTEEALLLSEASVKNKLKAITEPEGDIGTLELSDIIDIEILQSIMDDFYQITGMLGAVLDLSGKVLVAVGWQDICTKFHRCNPETLKNCIESDTILTQGVKEGTFKSYRCKNNMWDIATPLIVGGRHVGNIFMGQYFLEDEVPDVELFRRQAGKYGFDEEEYLAALDRVPRFSRETVDRGMQFYSKLAGIISKLSFSTIKQSRIIAENEKSKEEIKSQNTLLSMIMETSPVGIVTADVEGNINYANYRAEKILGIEKNKITARKYNAPEWNPIDVDGSPFPDEKQPFYIVKSTGKTVHNIQQGIRWPDGRTVFLSVNASPLRDKEGQFSGMVAALEDITDRRKMEEKTKKAYALLKTAESLAHIGSWEWNIQKDKFIMSEEWLQIHGITNRNLTMDELMLISHPDDAKTVEKNFKDALDGIRPYDITHRIIRQDTGEERVVHAKGIVSFDKQGKPDRMLGTSQDITEKVKSDQALKESEEKFRALYENAPLAYQSLNEDGSFKDINPAGLRTLGYERNEIIGKFFKDLLHPDWQAHFENNFPKFKKRGFVSDVQFKIRHKTGHYLDISFEGCIGYNPDGSFKQTYCVFTDITEKLKSDQELKESEERFRQAVTYAPYPIMIHADGRVLQLSEEWIKQTGYTIDNIPTIKEWAVKAYGKDAVPGEDFIENLYKIDKAQHDGEWKVKIKNGEYRLWDFSSSPIGKLQNGKKMVISMASDITERKKAEVALAAEKERLTVTLRSIGDGVITTDTKGNIVMLNKVAEALTGWTSNEASGRPLPEVFNIINENTREKCKNPVEKVLAKGGIIELENHTCLIAKDGREIVIADSGSPIRNKKSQIIGVVLVFRDMTEKHKLEDVIQKTQKLESLGILAGGIAHDFNNILGAIFGYTELAMMKTEEEDVSAFLKKSLSNIDRARALTEQLLTFAKGGAPIKNVENLFPFVQETTQFALSGSSVSAVFQIQENLRPCSFDKNKIGQVIDNLTINAQQAMPMGGTILVSAINISLTEKEHITLTAGNYVKLSIKDQGIGIPKEFLTNIFDPYYTTKPNGHGLGLATCFSIINRHDGCIEVESEPGKGSTFHIYLPAAADPVAERADKSEEEHRGSGTFLVMDDEETNREIMKELLESFGYTVILKENGQDAVDFFVKEFNSKRKLSGMIFDLTVPGGMGGKEAIGEIRKICLDTPVFVASGYSGDPVIANPEEYGFTASILKPFMKEELSKMLEKYL